MDPKKHSHIGDTITHHVPHGAVDPKKLPPLTEAEIDNIQKFDPNSPLFLRLCAQAKRYPAMVEALEKLKTTDLDDRACRIVTAALKGETPQ